MKAMQRTALQWPSRIRDVCLFVLYLHSHLAETVLRDAYLIGSSAASLQEQDYLGALRYA